VGVIIISVCYLLSSCCCRFVGLVWFVVIFSWFGIWVGIGVIGVRFFEKNVQGGRGFDVVCVV
jgi:hypothetical protein